MRIASRVVNGRLHLFTFAVLSAETIASTILSFLKLDAGAITEVGMVEEFGARLAHPHDAWASCLKIKNPYTGAVEIYVEKSCKIW